MDILSPLIPISGGREKEQDKFEVWDKTEHDTTADLFVPDVWLRWLLLAAEDIICKLAVSVVLRKVGLERLIDNYPPYEQPRPSKRFTFGDYAAVSTGLLNFCGWGSESQILDMDRVMVKHSTMEQGALYGIGSASFPKFASLPAQVKMGMEVIVEAVRRTSHSIGQDHRLSLEDRGDKLAYIVQDYVFCAGKQSNKPMCMFLTGNLQEAPHWLTGEVIHVEEVECRAMGAKACVWEIDKQSREHM